MFYYLFYLVYSICSYEESEIISTLFIYLRNYLASPLKCLYRNVNVSVPKIKPSTAFPTLSTTPTILLLNNTIHPDSHANNLRITFRHSTLLSHIYSVPIICQFYLQSTSRFLPTTFGDTTSVPAINLSHLERCNNLFSLSSLDHLSYLNTQFIPYMEAKVMFKKCTPDDATALFKSLLTPVSRTSTCYTSHYTIFHVHYTFAILIFSTFQMHQVALSPWDLCSLPGMFSSAYLFTWLALVSVYMLFLHRYFH